MGSVFRRDDGWVVKWLDGAGIWRTKRTKCVTKLEAKLLIADLERQAERQRLGLESRPSDTRMTLEELCRWWLGQRQGPARNRKKDEGRLEKHVFGHRLGATALPGVTTERIEELLAQVERNGAAAASVNRLRTTLHSAFSRAKRMKLWTGPNPVSDVETRRVPKRLYVTLRADEVPLVLPCVDAEWRNFFATELWTGLRKGELCGLLKADVDLESRVIMVGRSYEVDTTKGGHADAIPIAEPLVPYLEDALGRWPESAFLFPAPDGSMRPEGSTPHRVLRKALVAAGLVERWEHVCRRCKSLGKEEHLWAHKDEALRRCPTCTMKLWSRPVPKKMRFHDLRHTTATLLLRAKVDAHRVQRILRHASINTTLGTYGHLDVEDLRDAINALPLGPVMPITGAQSAEVRTMDASSPVVGTSTETKERKGVASHALEVHKDFQGTQSNDKPFNAAMLPLTAQTGVRVPVGSSVQIGGVTGEKSATPPNFFGAPSLRPTAAPKNPAAEGAPQLLTVRQVAGCLALSTAGVYALCERGELPHSRISNAIRVSAADLQAFIEARRQGVKDSSSKPSPLAAGGAR